jgi:hypothetical protein
MDQVFTAGIHRHRHDVPAELLEVFDLAEQGVALIFESVCRQELLEAELCQPLLVVVAGFKLEKMVRGWRELRYELPCFETRKRVLLTGSDACSSLSP